MEVKAQANWNAATAARLAVLFAVAVTLSAALFSGAAAAHDNGDGLTVHNQTKTLDEHDEVHTITVDRATAETEFYIDVHVGNESINKTSTYDGGSVKTNLTLTLHPTLTATQNVTVAVHATNGTELAAQTATVSVTDGSAQNGTETSTVVSEIESEMTQSETDSETSKTKSEIAETDADDDTTTGDSTEEPTDGGGPGFGVAAALLALVGATFLARRN